MGVNGILLGQNNNNNNNNKLIVQKKGNFIVEYPFEKSYNFLFDWEYGDINNLNKILYCTSNKEFYLTSQNDVLNKIQVTNPNTDLGNTCNGIFWLYSKSGKNGVWINLSDSSISRNSQQYTFHYSKNDGKSWEKIDYTFPNLTDVTSKSRYTYICGGQSYNKKNIYLLFQTYYTSSSSNYSMIFKINLTDMGEIEVSKVSGLKHAYFSSTYGTIDQPRNYFRGYSLNTCFNCNTGTFESYHCPLGNSSITIEYKSGKGYDLFFGGNKIDSETEEGMLYGKYYFYRGKINDVTGSVIKVISPQGKIFSTTLSDYPNFNSDYPPSLQSMYQETLDEYNSDYIITTYGKCSWAKRLNFYNLYIEENNSLNSLGSFPTTSFYPGTNNL